MRALAYSLYSRRLRRKLSGGPIPRHVAIIMDGNRRWARSQGFADVNIGHRHGAEHIEPVLGWCAEVGVKHVTVFVASTENLTSRDSGEMDHLMQTMERIVHLLSGWQLRVAGRLELLPDSTRDALKLAQDRTASSASDLVLTVAIGYGGRQEVVDALRSLLTTQSALGVSIDELAERLTADDITDHLYTSGLPDPDLIIRTSGELRLSGFLLWQSAYSELYFCDVYWPAFRHVDFLRALRSYANRQRRFGG